MSNFKSQAGQDLFALEQTNYKEGGFFLEIGAYDSQKWSNTYVLEIDYGWSGIALEIDPERAAQYNSNRKSTCVIADATKIDYQELLEKNGAPRSIDFLSLDIEPAQQTFDALLRVMETKYTFKTITFEHDLYVSKRNLQIKMFQKVLLKSKGYSLYRENVCSGNNPAFPFEDWWVL